MIIHAAAVCLLAVRYLWTRGAWMCTNVYVSARECLSHVAEEQPLIFNCKMKRCQCEGEWAADGQVIIQPSV